MFCTCFILHVITCDNNSQKQFLSQRILRIALFIDNYDFMTTCVQYLRLNNVRLCNSTYDTLIVCPVRHIPPPAVFVRIFLSCIFQPCTFVRHFPVLHFPVPQIQSPRICFCTLYYWETVCTSSIVSLNSLSCCFEVAKIKEVREKC